MVTLLKATGERSDVSPARGAKLSLREMQALVGGYIEILRLADGRLLVCNEEGKLRGLPLNDVATELFQVDRAWYDPIVGDVLLCTAAEVD